MRHRRALTLILLGWLTVSAPGTVTAAEADKSGAQTDSTKSSEGAQPPKAEAEAKPGGKTQSSAEIFIPTEEISEDFSVAFPVDI